MQWKFDEKFDSHYCEIKSISAKTVPMCILNSIDNYCKIIVTIGCFNSRASITRQGYDGIGLDLNLNDESSLTWEASMCWDRWKGKGFGVLPVPWADRLPFSRPPAPDTEANRCPMPMAENAPGAIANCPGWNNRGCPVFSGLKKCWLCRPESAKLWRCPVPKCEGLSVCIIRGE